MCMGSFDAPDTPLVTRLIKHRTMHELFHGLYISVHISNLSNKLIYYSFLMVVLIKYMFINIFSRLPERVGCDRRDQYPGY